MPKIALALNTNRTRAHALVSRPLAVRRRVGICERVGFSNPCVSSAIYLHRYESKFAGELAWRPEMESLCKKHARQVAKRFGCWLPDEALAQKLDFEET